MELRLEDPVLGVLPLDCDNGYVVTRYDLGFPEVREVVVPRTTANGTIDTTSLFGARVVTLDVTFQTNVASDRQLRDRLFAYALPNRRPTLFITETGDTLEMKMELRGADAGVPIVRKKFNAASISWVCPDGVRYATTPRTARIAASTDSEVGGLTFPITFPLSWPSSAPSGSATVRSNGNVDAWPLIRMYGPCTDPALINLTTGGRFEFDGLTVNAGDFVQLDPDTKRVLYNGDPNDSRAGDVDWAQSDWWPLIPGDQLVRYRPATFSSPAAAVLTWLDPFV